MAVVARDIKPDRPWKLSTLSVWKVNVRSQFKTFIGYRTLYQKGERELADEENNAENKNEPQFLFHYFSIDRGQAESLGIRRGLEPRGSLSNIVYAL